jgi:hypothetical protein
MTTNTENETRATTAGSAYCNYAIVLRTTRDRIPFIRRAIAGYAGRVFWEDAVEPDILLYIERKLPNRYIPREREQ